MVLDSLRGVDPAKVLLMPQGTNRDELDRRAAWLVEVCNSTASATVRGYTLNFSATGAALDASWCNRSTTQPFGPGTRFRGFFLPHVRGFARCR